MDKRNAAQIEAIHALNQIFKQLNLDDERLRIDLIGQSRFREFKKGQVIIKSGAMASSFFVILSGLVRYYFLMPHGKEWNKAFFHEGHLVGSLSSFLLDKPCSYAVEALENSFLAELPMAIFTDQTSRNEQLTTLFNDYVQKIMLRNEEREALLLTCNSEERYRWVLENQAWLERRIPQFHLASYLGMEPASLSRIKRSIELS